MALDAGRERPDDLVQSVARAFRVLEVVTRYPGLPVKAIARRSDLNLSTTYHLVRTLAYEGYVTRLKDGTYDVGEQVSHRFYDALGALGRTPGTREVLRHLAQTTGYSAYLGRFSAGRVVLVDYFEGPGSPYLEDLERGLEVSAHATALGKALLLGMPRRDRRELLAEAGMRRFTSRTAADVPALDAQLSRLRLDAVVEEHGEFREDLACAARLVPGRTGRAGDESGWAVVLASPGEDVPVAARRELSLAAKDLAIA
ncbi:IclR family transcriptional regulator [Promicromonospora sp. Populi]|uniref:IclR family transcriptional regulator n=1 Tax=Promicromonospora sp. Populi TaxID=3239420 RepID=UPI0034E20820